MSEKRYTVLYTKQFQKQMKKFRKKNPQEAIRIMKWIEERLVDTDNPYRYAENLSNNISDVRYRIGDYRLVANIEHEKVVIEMVRFDHRKQVYKR